MISYIKILWFLVIPASTWAVTIIHHLAGFSLLEWYAIPLLITYTLFIVVMLVVAVNKIIP